MGLEVAFGNNKLDKNIAIFNMNSATDCPSEKLGLCELCDICYAKKAEVQYPAVLPYRRRQESYWDSCTAEQFVSELLEKATYKVGAKKGTLKIDTLRVSESGDFKGQDDVDKLDKIANLLKESCINTYCYTARKDLDFSKAKSVTVNGSGFMVHNTFKAFNKGDVTGRFICRGDCGPCTLCVYPRGLEIFVEKH